MFSPYKPVILYYVVLHSYFSYITPYYHMVLQNVEAKSGISGNIWTGGRELGPVDGPRVEPCDGTKALEFRAQGLGLRGLGV